MSKYKLEDFIESFEKTVEYYREKTGKNSGWVIVYVSEANYWMARNYIDTRVSYEDEENLKFDLRVR